MPATPETSWFNRRITSVAEAWRWFSGFSPISTRPEFSDWFCASTPTKEETLLTAGSCRIASAIWRWRAVMAW